ncbi:hypothetical protein IHQ71_04425 [Rhizobium sp. TH2]|uniref:winged helix domain-containing protein n=1 Tax=Rhizobium sp. TH2 TaxID=2775403 RepID=UPI002157605D|nr:hypothetical protein [Rhizobium sp. TH2]UVC09865.1 hypothetical protein IHQ71_04425 [Rhizobium sp. TH2]
MKKIERLEVVFRILPDGQPMKAIGRDAWMLKELIRVGSRGLTSLENPAPRISGYVLKLRKRGLVIETIHENHDGPFAGNHARYVLRSEVAVISDSSKPDAEGIAA